MTKNQSQTNNMERLEDDLTALAEKHGLVNCALCATRASDNYFVAYAAPTKSPSSYFDIVLNVGRMWQWTRDEVRKHLNQFERPKE